MKKFISLLLTAIMLLSICGAGFTVNAAAADSLCTGDIIEYGTYPNSEVKDPELIAQLDSIEKDWVSYGYYFDNVQKDSYKYCDIEYGGEKYRAVIISARRVSKYGATGYELNKAFYFKYEPIEWIVLDPDSGLVVTENLVDSQPFSNTYYESGDSTYSDSARTKDINDYETSSIRSWLDTTFYNTAFTDTEKASIQLSEICITEKETGDTAKFVENRVFLLSKNEATNNDYMSITPGVDLRYGGQSYHSRCRAQSTDYARSQGLSVYNSSGGITPERLTSYSGRISTCGLSEWYTRTPYTGAL